MSKSKILSGLPPVERAVGYLNLDTRDWLNAAGVRPQTIDRINRATMRASHAVELARGGSKKGANLGRARDAMITYLNLMRFLCLHDYLSYAQFDEAERRVEQIQAGLAELERLALAKWPELNLAPLRPLRAIEPSPSGRTEAPSSGDSSRPQVSASGSLEESARSAQLAVAGSDGRPIGDDSSSGESPEDENEETPLVNEPAGVG